MNFGQVIYVLIFIYPKTNLCYTVKSIFQEFDFQSIRVSTPVVLVVNGRKLGREKQVGTVLVVNAVSD